MSNDEVIESLKAFEKERIENLDKTSRNLFDAIMRIADERDLYKKLIEYLKTLDLYEFELDYDYEENPISNYNPVNLGEYIENWLKDNEVK